MAGQVWDKSKSAPLCGVVSGVHKRYCFIKNTDCRHPYQENPRNSDRMSTFTQLPDAFAHETCFNAEEWPFVSIGYTVRYFAEVVKRAHSGALKMHVTSAWVEQVEDEEEEEEEEEQGEEEMEEEAHDREEDAEQCEEEELLKEEQHNVEEGEDERDDTPPALTKRRRAQRGGR